MLRTLLTAGLLLVVSACSPSTAPDIEQDDAQMNGDTPMAGDAEMMDDAHMNDGDMTDAELDGPCAGVVCKAGERCREGVCVGGDPCDDVVCGDGESCVEGECVAGGRRSCDNVMCAETERCENGTCIAQDLCADVTCPDLETCVEGECMCISTACLLDEAANTDPCDGGTTVAGQAAGELSYLLGRCASCHGDRAEGLEGIAPALTGDCDLIFDNLVGDDPHPTGGPFDRQDAEDLAAYINSL